MATHVVLAVHDDVVNASGSDVRKLICTVTWDAQDLFTLHQDSVAVTLLAVAVRAELCVQLLSGLSI